MEHSHAISANPIARKNTVHLKNCTGARIKSRSGVRFRSIINTVKIPFFIASKKDFFMVIRGASSK
jgi:hypothetical protein